MENKVKELKEMGHDITNIIEGTKHPRVLIQFYKIHKNQDVVIPEWTNESITRFSNRIYNIVTGENKNGQKENFRYEAIRGNQANPKRQ